MQQTLQPFPSLNNNKKREISQGGCRINHTLTKLRQSQRDSVTASGPPERTNDPNVFLESGVQFRLSSLFLKTRVGRNPQDYH